MNSFVMYLGILFLAGFLSSCTMTQPNQMNNISSSASNEDSVLGKNARLSSGQMMVSGAVDMSDPMSRIVIPSKTLLIQQIRERKSSIYDEEIPRIQSYGQEDAFFEYFIFQSLYQQDIAICKQAPAIKQKLCTDLYENMGNKEKFIQILQDNGESGEYARNFYSVSLALSQKTEVSTDMKDITLYLAYRKILSPSIDVEGLYFAYLRFELLLPSIDKEKHLEALFRELSIDKDDSMKGFIKNTLI